MSWIVPALVLLGYVLYIGSKIDKLGEEMREVGQGARAVERRVGDLENKIDGKSFVVLDCSKAIVTQIEQLAKTQAK